jgi:carboxylesterase
MKVGVLCIHGFTGGPYEVKPFVDYLKMHTDWPVEVPTLPGHGITLNLANYSAESWMMEAELALRKLQNEVDRIIVVGFSMGGLIAMYLALRYPLSKLILLSAASRYISPRVLLDDVRKMIMESITKNHSPNTFYHLYNYKLTNTPLRAIIEFLRIVKMVEPYFGLISTPVCIVQGKKD